MKNSFLFLAIVLVLFAGRNYAQDNKENTGKISIEKFDPSRDASKDLENAIADAEKSNKRIILDVGGEWCIWCHRLDTMFIKNPDVYNFMNQNFVYLKINYSKENKNEKFLSQFPEIPGYPHWFILDSNGKLLLSKSSGDFEAGKGHDPKIVMEFLEKWVVKKKS